MTEGFDFILDKLMMFLDWVINLLPMSPFTCYINAIDKLPYLDYLNWFVPIGTFIAIGQAWLISIGLFYAYSIVLRWVKAIE